MKALVFVISLFLSLPNLLAGFALAVVQRTFADRNLLAIIDRFLESVVWGIPVAGGAVLLLLIAGVISESRRYAALASLFLNLLALGLVLFRIRPVHDLSQAIFFVPVLLALVGFAWLAWAPSPPRGDV